MSLKRKATNLPSAVSDASKKAKSSSSITSFFGAPKSSPSSSSGSAPALNPKFNKEKWVEGLKPEQKQLLKLEIDTLDETWLSSLKETLITKEFLELKKFLKSEIDAGKKVFPPAEDVYSWCVKFRRFVTSTSHSTAGISSLELCPCDSPLQTK
jgi:uracil-DNA glycosylase